MVRKRVRLYLANRDLKSDVVADVTELSGREFQIGTICRKVFTAKKVFMNVINCKQEGLWGAENVENHILEEQISF